MQCPGCQAENPDASKFCSQCGRKLERECPDCAIPVATDARFCHQCGTSLEPVSSSQAPSAPERYTPPHLAQRILESRAAIEGERKQVTILFADIEGSTDLVRGLDPEDASRLLEPALQSMMAAVHRYEGTVNRVQGDGLMAMFGAPLAHEDHALRACHAALDMQHSEHDRLPERATDPTLSLRVGLHSGEVVVRAINNDLSMNYDAMGLTAHLASRMEQLAAPDSIRLTADTLRLVEGYVETEALGATNVKGLTDPLDVFELNGLTGARTRLQAAQERDLTPYIGRDPELQVLGDCFSQASEGQGRVVLISGEAGIGKSRLLLEFRRRLGEQATWLEGQTLSFGESMAFHPLVDLMRRNFRIEEDDDEAAIIEKITDSVVRLDPELRPILPYLRHLMAVDPGDEEVAQMDPALRRGELFASVRRLMLRAAEARPQIIVIEDLHWIDQATELFLTQIADSVPSAPVLCLFTYRPGYEQPFGERTFHTRLALSTLSSEDTVHMTGAMLSAQHLPAELEQLVVGKAEGNPFFVEEVVKSLQETDAIRPSEDGDGYELTRPLEQIAVPDTIQDVIMARIDRLPDAPKRTLQLAAVIGRDFTYRLLDRIGDLRDTVEPHVRELKSIELIYERSLYPELAYMFKHALTQDVAYNSLLVKRRKELHGTIGRAIEELYADRITEHYEVLAHHFGRGENWNLARTYFVKAAGKAAQSFANREAIALLDQAQAAAKLEGDGAQVQTLRGIHQTKSGLYFLLGDLAQSEAEAGHALGFAREGGDELSQGEALVSMGIAALYAHKFDLGVDHARRAIEISERTKADGIAGGAHFITGLAQAATGAIDEGTADMRQAVVKSRAGKNHFYDSMSTFAHAFFYNWRGDFEESLRRHMPALTVAREHRQLFPLIAGLWGTAVVLTGLGRFREARAYFTESQSLAERCGEEMFRIRGLNSIGWLLAECGDWDGAIDFNRRAVVASKERIGDAETLANAELNLADVFVLQRDFSASRQLLEGIHRLVRNPATSDWTKWRYSMHLFASLGEHWLANGEPAKAADFAGQCLELASSKHSKKYLVRAWRLNGEIAMANRQFEDAGDALRSALTVARAIGNPTQLWKTLIATGNLHHENGRVHEATKAYQSAREVIDGIKSGLPQDSTQAGLARLQQLGPDASVK